MNSYEIYRLYDSDSSRHSVQSIACKDDLAALAEAKRQAREQAVEIWQGQRFVARVKKDDEELNASDRQSL